MKPRLRLVSPLWLEARRDAARYRHERARRTFFWLLAAFLLALGWLVLSVS